MFSSLGGDDDDDGPGIVWTAPITCDLPAARGFVYRLSRALQLGEQYVGGLLDPQLLEPSGVQPLGAKDPGGGHDQAIVREFSGEAAGQGGKPCCGLVWCGVAWEMVIWSMWSVSANLWSL